MFIYGSMITMKQEILPNAVYTTEEVAQLLHLNILTVQKFIREGRISATRISDRWYRVTGQSLLDFLSNNMNPPKGLWIDESTGVIECPYCEKRIAIMTQSHRLENGQERKRYKKTIVCSQCGKKFRLY